MTGRRGANVFPTRGKISIGSPHTLKERKEWKFSAADLAEDEMNHAFYFVGASGFSVKEYSPQRPSAAKPQPKKLRDLTAKSAKNAK